MQQVIAIGKALVERCAPVIIDSEAIKILTEKTMAVLESKINVDGVSYEQLLERSFALLMVSEVFELVIN